MRRTLQLIPALALVALSSRSADAQRWYDDVNLPGVESCRDIWEEYGRSMSGRPRAVHCEVREVGTVARRERIDVDGDRHTGVHIKGAQRNDVRVRLVVQAQGEDVADARRLASEVTMDLTSAVWRADVPEIRDERRNGRRWVTATIVVETPVESNVTARSEHASLKVENVRGRLDLDGTHGPVHVSNVGGDVRARVQHGPLHVVLSGAQWQGTGLDAEATHGPLVLRLPRDYGAQLELGAEHGPFDIDFPITLNRFDKSRIETKLGAGGPRIRAYTAHGPLSVRTNSSSRQ
jgi:hypothetical protein